MSRCAPVAEFAEVLFKLQRDGDAAVLAAGTADADHQLALAFLAVQRHRKVQQFERILQKPLCVRAAEHVVAHRLVVAGQRLELGYVKRVGQTAHIQHHVRLQGKSVFEAEGHEGQGQPLGGADPEQRHHALAQLLGGKVGRVDVVVGMPLDSLQQRFFHIDRVGDRAVLEPLGERMLAARFFEAHDQHVGFRVEKQQLDVGVRIFEVLDLLRHLLVVLVAAHVDHHRDALHAIVARAAAEVVERRQQRRRDVVHAVVAYILQHMQGGGLAGARHAGDDHKFHEFSFLDNSPTELLTRIPMYSRFCPPLRSVPRGSGT